MTIRSAINISLTSLRSGLPGITPSQGQSCEEACLVCFENQMHSSGVLLSLRGIPDAISPVIMWPQSSTKQINRAHNDLQDATEEAACGVAFLLIINYTEYTIVERSFKGTGFDYWAGFEENEEVSFEARLEVSGILSCDKESKFDSRIKSKIEQTKVTDHLGIPAYIVVVDFGEPKAHMEQR